MIAGLGWVADTLRPMTSIMDDEEVELTPEEWTAARLLIALLGAEAHGSSKDFDFDTLGVDIMPVEELVFALADGKHITVGDMMIASKMLLWSVVSHLAMSEEVEIEDVVSTIGLRLAAVEP